MVCAEIALLAATLGFIAFIFVQHKFSYWRKRHVPHTPPKFPLGSCQGLSRTRNLGDILKQKYEEGRGQPFTGVYIVFGPGLLVRDPELVKLVLTKEFASFASRGFKVNPDIDPLTGHLFFLDGPQWRNLRTKLTPTFTSGKMKMMFPIIEECSEEMTRYLAGKDVVEAGDLFTRFATNVVTRCAYGIDVDFFHAPEPRLQKMIHRVANPTFLDAVQRGLAFTLGPLIPRLPFRLVPKDLSNYFISLVRQTIDDRENNGIVRNDFMQLLIDLKNKGYLEDPNVKEPVGSHLASKFTVTEAAAQAFNFLIGGFDTSSVTMQFCLYELSLRPDIQGKLRDEINQLLPNADSKITYELLSEMKYLDQVISETMRKHPIATFLVRECVRPFQLNDLLVEVGTKVWISTAGLQSDPQHFPQPEVFDPDRFSPESKDTIHSYTYLPFGEGPRACIGNRFALMQMKTGLSYMLKRFRVQLCQQSPLPPLKMDPKKGLASIVDGVPLRFVPI